MLAKIGHSYAVAVHGLTKFEPLLLDLIVRNSGHPSFLIGGDFDILPPEPPHLHRMNLHRYEAHGDTFVWLTTRLFAYLGAPRYYIETGRTSCRERVCQYG